MYDLVVIGGGSAGYSAAMTAIEHNKKVCVIEKGPFGGLCILKGCMPSKTLIHSARISEEIKNAHKYGINVSGKTTFDIPKLINRKNKIIQGFANYRLQVLKKNRKDIDMVTGEAKFVSKDEVEVNGKIIKGKNFLISTGSRGFTPPIEDLIDIGFITSDEALEMKTLPKSIVCLGGGPVSLEMAYYFHNMGVETTVIQRSKTLLNNNDEDLGKSLEESLTKSGIKIYTDTSIRKFSKDDSLKVVDFDHKKKKVKIKAEEILLAFGRIPNVDKLDLDKIGLKTDNKGVPTLNEYLQTSESHIYAAGDANGLLEVVNVAVEHGRIAAENMFGKKQKINYNKFPMAVFTHPEVAWIGVSEKEAKEKNLKVKIGKLNYEDLGKAICYGEEDGFIKFIVEKKTNKILGVSIIGHLASDIIHEAVPLLYYNATLEDLSEMQHIHPTFGEIYSYLVEEML
ncbi:MAG: dihydrolipoyl dehydrogenase [Nanoarchaeota archaeon]|nr:dihydrolipoyl dehydrogenase [Nanoarchaeota archaeon]